MQVLEKGVVSLTIHDRKEAKDTEAVKAQSVVQAQSRPMGTMGRFFSRAAHLPGVSSLVSFGSRLRGIFPSTIPSAQDAKAPEFSASTGADAQTVVSIAVDTFPQQAVRESKSESLDVTFLATRGEDELIFIRSFSAVEFVETVRKYPDIEILKVHPRSTQFDDTYLTKLEPLLKLQHLEVNCLGESFTPASILALQQHPKLSMLSLRGGCGTRKLLAEISRLPLTQLALYDFISLDVHGLACLLGNKQLVLLILERLKSELTETHLDLISALPLGRLHLTACWGPGMRKMNVLSKNRYLYELVLDDCLIDDKDAAQIPFEQLEKLSLVSCDSITHETLKMIGERATRLQLLVLSNIECVNGDTLKFLQACKNLRVLVIDGCDNVNEEAFACLLEFAKLEHLYTHEKEIPGSILEQFQKRSPQIKHNDESAAEELFR